MSSRRWNVFFTVMISVMMIVTMTPSSAFANNADQYRYYYESTTMSTREIGTTIGISEEEVTLGYLCFLCNGSTYNFTWNRDYPLKVPSSEVAIPWNANITGKKLTIRDTSNNVVYTDELSGNNNVWRIKVESVNQDDPSQSILVWEPASVPTYTVTYNKNTEDSVDGLSSTTAVVPKDPNPTPQYTAEFYTKLPSISRTGYTFDGWYTEASGGTKVGGGGQNYLPKGDITLYAHWKGTGAYVSIDFGEGHEDYVQSKFGSIDGFTVDNAKLKYEVSDRADIAEARQTFMDTLDFSDDVDDGELFMNDVALHPVGDYADRDARQAEFAGYTAAVPSDGLTLYALWAQPVGEVSVTITPPEVGTEVSVINKGQATERTDPQVEATVTGNATLDTISARDWADSSYKGYFEGTVQDGQNCYARIHLDAKYGYYFAYDGGEGLVLADGTSVSGTNTSGVKVTPDHEYGVEFCGMVWAGSGDEPTVYDVKVDESISNGTVEAYPVTAHEGDTIEATVTPDSGYVLKAVTYTPEGGKAVSLDVPDSSGGKFSFEMPASDVTVSATFDKVNMVYVDFGKGHEDFVQTMYGNVDDYDINGSVVSFQCGTGEDASASDAYREFDVAPDQSVEPLDDGVCYMYDIALHTRDCYENEAALVTEQNGYLNTKINDGITFYALWADPAKPRVTITPPECGTEVTLRYKTGIYIQAQPAPDMTADGNCHFDDYQMFINSWDLSEYDVTRVDQSLVMKGDNTYKATGYLSSDWGYYMPKDKDSITVTGGSLDGIEGNHGSYTIGLTIGVKIEHDWGEWTVVKQPTTTEKGLKSRECKICHEIEEEEIPVIEPTPAPTQAKSVLVAKGIASGKKAIKLSWNKVTGADRYVIYLAKCNYKGKKYKYKAVKTVGGNTFKWTKKKLKKKTAYKFYVVAQKKTGSGYTTIATSSDGHTITGNVRGKLTNPKQLKLNKSAITLKTGGSATIKGAVTKVKKKKKLATSHVANLRFVSNNPAVATVDRNGKVTAQSSGTAVIYVQTINGIWKTCKVTVK